MLKSVHSEQTEVQSEIRSPVSQQEINKVDQLRFDVKAKQVLRDIKSFVRDIVRLDEIENFTSDPIKQAQLAVENFLDYCRSAYGNPQRYT